jgi:hypothetical protein
MMYEEKTIKVDGDEYASKAFVDKVATKQTLLETIGPADPLREPNHLFISRSWPMKNTLDGLLEFVIEKGFVTADIPEKLREIEQVWTAKDGQTFWKTLVFKTLTQKIRFMTECSRMYTRNLDHSDNVGTDGKPLNSRPKILADCIRRLDSVKQDLEQLQTEYEEWSSNINEGATQDKCNDAEQMIADQACTVDEVITELEGLEGELPMGFGRD